MEALIYMMKRSFVNNLRRALKKPITYLYLVGGVGYAVMIIVMLDTVVRKSQFASAYGLVALITAWTYYVFAVNFSGYAKKKGIIFKPSHAHFIFTAPISPKVVLLTGASKNFVFSLVMVLIFAIGGGAVFRITFLQGVIFFVFAFVLEVILEMSQMIILYTNERLSTKTLGIISNSIYVLLGVIAVFLILYFRENGFTMESVKVFADHPILQMFPIVGWNVAAFRLILLGPTTLNIICTILYVATAGIMLLIAVKMQCTGGYYEDAAKFADDYAEFRTKNKKGDMTFSIGKRKKFKSVTSTYNGKGAKAVFYRQLLEYKKERYFIFGYMTLVCVGGAVFLIKGIGRPGEFPPEAIMLGVIAYLVLLTSGYSGKWEKELKNAYLYLIPDTSMRKLWYATLMEHIKAAIDGCILVIPVGIAWHVSFFRIVLIILIYVVLQANKLYLRVFADSIMGDVLGKVGKNIMRAFIQMAILGTGAGIAFVVGISINMELIFPIVLIYSMIITVVIAFLASKRFTNMEQMD